MDACASPPIVGVAGDTFAAYVFPLRDSASRRTLNPE
ncbi:hypothetical protein HNQ52_000265 [Chiayiivirga flava]|uniref:Uncharacterized protein n=1 Tax=Chiayiivirga flava TaxID=659595 RepID=A0A7W8D2L9_9GAMM|nr:hypothetical protein [Chiayiivirga flava]